MRQHKFVPNIYTRFLSKVDVQGFDPEKCWIWNGAGKGNGYGNVNFRGKTIPAHRVAYELFVGRAIGGLDVCHACDNRACVNPDHLYLGSRQENVDDAVERGTIHRKARKHLTREQVEEVLRQLRSGIDCRRIATLMNIGYETVTSIQRGDSYGGIAE